MDEDFYWRVEMACRAAWPAEMEHVERGWQFRRSGGTIRRVNSVNPLQGAAAPDDGLIDGAEDFYRGFGQRAMFRLMDFLGHDAACLERRGYAVHGETLTLHAPLASMPDTDTGGADVASAPGSGWLAARERMAGSDHDIYRSMLSLIKGPRLFASAGEGEEIVSIAYGVIHDGLLIVESVATDGAFRGRGHARRTVGALMKSALAAGISDVALQVVAANPPARALYRRLGFCNELFAYHYRYQPVDP